MCLQLFVWQCSHQTPSGLKYTSIMRPLELPLVNVLSRILTPCSLMLKCSRGGSRGCVSFSLYWLSNCLMASFAISPRLLKPIAPMSLSISATSSFGSFMVMWSEPGFGLFSSLILRHQLVIYG